MPQHDGKRQDRKRQKVQNSLRPAAGRCRDPKRRPPYVDALPLLAPIRRPSIVAGQSPERVIGRRGDRSHLMSASGKPRRHFPRVLADSRRLRGEVCAVHQNLHSSTFYSQSGTTFRQNLNKFYRRTACDRVSAPAFARQRQSPTLTFSKYSRVTSQQVTSSIAIPVVL